MADLLDGMAQYLMGLDLLTYAPDGPGGDTALEAMPSSPDECVVLTLYGSTAPDSKLGYDPVNLQVRARGPASSDPRPSRTRAWAIYDALHGLGSLTLPDGTYLLLCRALQVPASMGLDTARRMEHVTNYALETRSVTTHRV